MPPLVTPDALGLVLLPEPPELPPQAATTNNNPQAAAMLNKAKLDPPADNR